MNKLNPDSLERCLASIHSREATAEQCLAEFPQEADELRSLLETARLIEQPQVIEPDPVFRARCRVALLNATSSNTPRKATVTPIRMLAFWDGFASEIQHRIAAFSSRQVLRPLVAGLLVVFLLLASSTGAIYASQDALPGDPLYQVKLAAEYAQLSLAGDEEARVWAKMDLASKRLAEMELALMQGRIGSASAAADALAKDLADIDRYLSGATANNQDKLGPRHSSTVKLAAQLAEMQVAAQEGTASLEDSLENMLASHGRANKTRSGNKKDGQAPSETPTPTAVPSSTATAVASGSAVTATATVTATVNVSSTIQISTTVAVSDVESLKNDPEVSGQSYKGLLAKLEAAQAAADRGHAKTALNILGAFENQLDAFNRSGHISPENYAKLKSDYEGLASSLNSQMGAQATPEASSTPEAEHEQERNKNRNQNAREKQWERENERNGSQLVPSPTSTPGASNSEDQSEDNTPGNQSSGRGSSNEAPGHNKTGDDNPKDQGQGNQGQGSQDKGDQGQKDKNQGGNSQGNASNSSHPPKNEGPDNKKQEPQKRR